MLKPTHNHLCQWLIHRHNVVLSFLQVLFMLWLVFAYFCAGRPSPNPCTRAGTALIPLLLLSPALRVYLELSPTAASYSPIQISTAIHLLPIYTISTKVTLYLQLLKNVQFLTWVTCAKLYFSTNRPMCTQRTWEQ